MIVSFKLALNDHIFNIILKTLISSLNQMQEANLRNYVLLKPNVK
jgi:hypothetical protein